MTKVQWCSLAYSHTSRSDAAPNPIRATCSDCGKISAKTKARKKDTEARWTKKNNEKHYGCKNHINADQTHKLIQTYTVTDAAVHDSQAIDALLDKEADANGDKRPVYADSAYRSKEREADLAHQDITSQICEKGSRGHPLSEEQKASNHAKSKVR